MSKTGAMESIFLNLARESLPSFEYCLKVFFLFGRAWNFSPHMGLSHSRGFKLQDRDLQIV